MVYENRPPLFEMRLTRIIRQTKWFSYQESLILCDVIIYVFRKSWIMELDKHYNRGFLSEVGCLCQQDSSVPFYLKQEIHIGGVKNSKCFLIYKCNKNISQIFSGCRGFLYKYIQYGTLLCVLWIWNSTRVFH